ncbi:MAG: 4-carboxymuconolactone decarboxylase [Legionellales bacterium]|nr:4-carboxymuconolactone decarboxylase [Legionellales bacterium]|tara:strand:+ start:1714 stop:2076 length:363 start_codon:yes stop_codon:yes gene_type:complete
MNTQQGKQRIVEILGNNADAIIDNFQTISPDFAKYVVDFAYGDLYSRSGLTDKSREIAVVSSLIGQGKTGLPLHAHFLGMLNVGWTKEEIIELIIFLIGCVGFPSCVEALGTLKEVLEQQ